MGIPGSKPKIEIHAKVRIGVKKTSQGGKEYPAAVDYFVSDAPEFVALVGDKPRVLSIRLVQDQIEDVFSTGLEWWVRSKEATRSTLACYTKDDGPDPIALRKDQMLDRDDVVRGEKRGEDRLPITCRARECPHFKSKDCKPMGRLVFVLDGDPLGHVWQIDTKAWNSIEGLAGSLRLAQTRGPLSGRLFELSVAFKQKGSDRFPVMTIQEISDISPQAGKAVANAESTIAVEQTSGDERAKLIAAIRARDKDPRDPVVAAWVQEKGIGEALRLLTEAVE